MAKTKSRLEVSRSISVSFMATYPPKEFVNKKDAVDWMNKHKK